MAEQGSSHPCHNLSNPSKRIFWCRHCMAKFVDPIQRWRHSKTCKRIISSNPKQELVGTDGKRLVVSAGTTEGSVVVSKDEEEEHVEPMVSRRKIRRLHMNDLVCQICKREFFSLDEMREHVKNPCRKILEGRSSTELVKADSISLEKEDSKEKHPSEYANEIEAGLRQMEESLAIRSDVADEIVANQIESLLKAAQVLQQQQQQEQQEASLDLLDQLPNTETVIIQPDGESVEAEYIITTNPEVYGDEYEAVTVETVGTVESIDPANVRQITVCPETGLVQATIPTAITEPDELQLISEVIAREEPELTRNCAFVPPSCRSKSSSQTTETQQLSKTSSNVNLEEPSHNSDLKKSSVEKRTDTDCHISCERCSKDTDKISMKSCGNCTKCELTDKNVDSSQEKVNQDVSCLCNCSSFQICNDSSDVPSVHCNKCSQISSSDYVGNCLQMVDKLKKADIVSKKEKVNSRINPIEKMKTRSLSKAERKVYPIRKRLKASTDVDIKSKVKKNSKLVLKCKAGVLKQTIKQRKTVKLGHDPKLKSEGKIKKQDKTRTSPQPDKPENLAKTEKTKRGDTKSLINTNNPTKIFLLDQVNADKSQETSLCCDEVDGINDIDPGKERIDRTIKDEVTKESEKKQKKPKAPKEPKCRICDRVFKTLQLLQKHNKVPCKIKHTRNLCQKVLRPKQVLISRSKPPTKPINNKKKSNSKPKHVIERLHLLPVSSRRISDTTLMIPKSKKIGKSKGRRKSAPSYLCYIPWIKEYKNLHIGVHIQYKSLPDKEQFFFDFGMINKRHLPKESETENQDICIDSIEKDNEDSNITQTVNVSDTGQVDSEPIAELQIANNDSLLNTKINISPVSGDNNVEDYSDATPPPVLEKVSSFSFEQSSWSDADSCDEPPELEFMSAFGIQAAKGGLLTRVYSPCDSNNSLDSWNSAEGYATSDKEMVMETQKSNTSTIDLSAMTSDYPVLSSPVNDDSSLKDPILFPDIGSESLQNLKNSSEDVLESQKDIVELPQLGKNFIVSVEHNSELPHHNSLAESSVIIYDKESDEHNLHVSKTCVSPSNSEGSLQNLNKENSIESVVSHQNKNFSENDEHMDVTHDILSILENPQNRVGNDESQSNECNDLPITGTDTGKFELELSEEMLKPCLVEKDNENHVTSLNKNFKSSHKGDETEDSGDKENQPSVERTTQSIAITKYQTLDTPSPRITGDSSLSKQKSERHFTDLLADLCTTPEVVFAPDKTLEGKSAMCSLASNTGKAQQTTKSINRHFMDAISMECQSDPNTFKKSTCESDSSTDHARLQLREKKLKNKVTVGIQTETNSSEGKIIIPSRLSWNERLENSSHIISKQEMSTSCDLDDKTQRTCKEISNPCAGKSSRPRDERINLFESLYDISPKRNSPNTSCASKSVSSSSARLSLFDSFCEVNGKDDNNQSSACEKVRLDDPGVVSKVNNTQTQHVEEVLVYPPPNVKILPQKSEQISSEFVSRTTSVPSGLSEVQEVDEENRKGIMELVAKSLGIESVENSSSSELPQSESGTFTVECDEGSNGMGSSPVVVNSVETTSCAEKNSENPNIQIIVMSNHCKGDEHYTSDINIINLNPEQNSPSIVCDSENSSIHCHELNYSCENVLSCTNIEGLSIKNTPQNACTELVAKKNTKSSSDSNLKIVMCGLEDLKPQNDEYVLLHQSELQKIDEIRKTESHHLENPSVLPLTSSSSGVTVSESLPLASNSFGDKSNSLATVEHCENTLKEMNQSESYNDVNILRNNCIIPRHGDINNYVDSINDGSTQNKLDRCKTVQVSSVIPVKDSELETLSCEGDVSQDSPRVMVQYVNPHTDYILLNQVPENQNNFLGKEITVKETSYLSMGD